MLTTEDQVLEALLKIACEVKNFAQQDVLPVSITTMAYAEEAIKNAGWKLELTGRFDPTIDVFTIRKLNQ